MSDIQPPGSPFDGWKWLGLVVLAAVGGVLSKLMTTMKAGAPVLFWPTFVQGMSSGFVGLLLMWLCESAHLSFQWTAVTVGVGGWLGAEASIQLIQRLVYSKVGLNNRSQDDDKPTG